MGPLQGFRIIELAGIGPGPFCGMLLSDLGAEVISIERPTRHTGKRDDAVCMRNRRSLCVDLKKPEGVELVLDLCSGADALYEGFRPGVAERLGLGPEPCMARNPGLVYGRITGWGQSGPLAQSAGHDINYIALSGALHAIGRAGEPPLPPLNLAGDYGGGGLFLALGILSALLEKSRSGQGQVVDASMVEGSAALMAVFYGLHGMGRHSTERGSNLLDTGAPFYEVYETRTEATQEPQYIAIGPLEPQFYELLIKAIGADETQFFPQHDTQAWGDRKARLAAIFRQRSRDQWCQLLEGTDACFAPVLSLTEAPDHPHNIARGSFITVDGIVQPAPAPKFSRSQPATPRASAAPGSDTDALLAELGYSAEKSAALRAAGAIPG
ncbi:CaiB/BaiF CoA transferase family protein [Parahaliea mediterranea]|uniref:CaiB/BaiF CoA transferase family protein n=1 Tax=Parahaliea mediterranea TaxID=651086 RepID=UPI000E2F4644|nr:CaiB/BaiF CoA-transferase family protein [Parahaliea mediterranea]